MTFLWLMSNIVIPAVMLFVLIGSVCGLALGLALRFRTGPTLAWIGSMNRWVSTRRALRPLEIPRHLSVKGRAGKVALGVFLAGGGAFVLYVMLARMQLPQIASVAGVDVKRWFAAAVVLHTTKWFIVAGSAFAVAVGVLLLAFPAALERMEASLNRWYSTRHLIPPSADEMKLNLEHLVERHPRAAGWLIAASCLLVALAMAILFAARP